MRSAIIAHATFGLLPCLSGVLAPTDRPVRRPWLDRAGNVTMPLEAKRTPKSRHGNPADAQTMPDLAELSLRAWAEREPHDRARHPRPPRGGVPCRPGGGVRGPQRTWVLTGTAGAAVR